MGIIKSDSILYDSLFPASGIPASPLNFENALLSQNGLFRSKSRTRTSAQEAHVRSASERAEAQEARRREAAELQREAAELQRVLALSLESAHRAAPYPPSYYETLRQDSSSSQGGRLSLETPSQLSRSSLQPEDSVSQRAARPETPDEERAQLQRVLQASMETARPETPVEEREQLQHALQESVETARPVTPDEEHKQLHRALQESMETERPITSYTEDEQLAIATRESERTAHLESFRASPPPAEAPAKKAPPMLIPRKPVPPPVKPASAQGSVDENRGAMVEPTKQGSSTQHEPDTGAIQKDNVSALPSEAGDTLPENVTLRRSEGSEITLRRYLENLLQQSSRWEDFD